MFNITPAVFAVGKEYQIMFYTPRPSYVWLKIGDRIFDDAACGAMRSTPGIRRITVPMSLLDNERSYTVFVKNIGSRDAYFTKQLAVAERTYDFIPVPCDRPIRAYSIGDAHGETVRPVAAANTFGDFDFLIIDGDVQDDSAREQEFVNMYDLAAMLTRGSKPVIYARGNHENRGAAAEFLPKYMPLRDGKTYYSFRLGNVWGMVLDCGEDKVDEHPEYGGSVRFHNYRISETKYIEKMIENAAEEYEAEGVEHRIVIVHSPFPFQEGQPFNIEEDIYRGWCALLRDKVHLDLIIAAHIHDYYLIHPGDEADHLGTPCPLAIASERKRDYYGGGGFIFGDDGIRVQYTTSKGEILLDELVEKS